MTSWTSFHSTLHRACLKNEAAESADWLLYELSLIRSLVFATETKSYQENKAKIFLQDLSMDELMIVYEPSSEREALSPTRRWGTHLLFDSEVQFLCLWKLDSYFLPFSRFLKMDSDRDIFFTQSVLIKPVSPQAYFFTFESFDRDAPPWGTWLRTLYYLLWWKAGKVSRRNKCRPILVQGLWHGFWHS